MKKVALFLAEGFEEVEAITPADFLRRSGVDVILAGVTGKKVTGSHGIEITCDVEVSELTGDLDGVIIPGGMPGASNIGSDMASMKIIQAALENGALVGAICAAPAVVLGLNGLIEGRHFTCYPGFETSFSGAFFSEDRVVYDGNLITSRGPGTAAEFSLALIEYLCGKESRDQIHKGTIQK
ncbi:DJ-1 family glyoxalase III [Spirochaeta isovalerica]|uniref:4-methyl-5(B-hydroxyethyl)-thiazole monophosphate biosynthesis n=1 Tax=Spirochaeta isovalerica TaxID=150 RepID=A0A841R6I8_9SPIO|nr:DJ-1 family glyoxalase III [Spirochaeta isovalerica]MBB6480814.1 4-methyl-5(b-hydroxyethyl)-thiazole monophosphate biosynthesis [Spirochaeta isovalerica]